MHYEINGEHTSPRQMGKNIPFKFLFDQVSSPEKKQKRIDLLQILIISRLTPQNQLILWFFSSFIR